MRRVGGCSYVLLGIRLADKACQNDGDRSSELHGDRGLAMIAFWAMLVVAVARKVARCDVCVFSLDAQSFTTGGNTPRVQGSLFQVTCQIARSAV